MHTYYVYFYILHDLSHLFRSMQPAGVERNVEVHGDDVTGARGLIVTDCEVIACHSSNLAGPLGPQHGSRCKTCAMQKMSSRERGDEGSECGGWLYVLLNEQAVASVIISCKDTTPAPRHECVGSSKPETKKYQER